jgi:uncharacterized protein YcaQ
VIVSGEDARAAFLVRQGLTLDPAWRSVHEAIVQIGAVQIDTIAVVARSHHLTLRHRVQSYDGEQLWMALRKRELFEYYVHGNSFIPIEGFPYIKHCMQRFPTHGYKWLRNTIPQYQDIMEKIRLRIQDEGPLTSRDLKDSKHQSRGWWDWKPAKKAIELLWWMGHIVVVDRIGFERVYDVTERGVPSKHLDKLVSTEEVWRHYLRRAVDCLVVATITDIRDYFNFHVYSLDKRQSEKKTLEEKVRVLKQEDAIVEVEVEDSATPHYILSDNLALIERARNHRASKDRAWFLSPFDNIVWDRKRVSRLFDADVRLEAYIPKAKRQFGYFAMPIIWKNRIVGRLDPKVDRKSNTLILANLELNLTKNECRDALEAIQEELTAFTTFHECEHLKIKRAKPAKLRDLLI